jgi:signal peptidase I
MFLKTSFQNKKADSISSPELIGPEKIMLFEDILNGGLTLRVKVTGESMAAVLRGGEILTIKKAPSSSLHIGDLIFFKTLYGIPLLHRVVRKQRDKDMFIFQTKGDALITMDQPVTEHNILGKVCRIEKPFSGGRIKQIEMESSIWKVINYFRAIISLGRSKAHILLRSGLFLSFRHVIKKVFI